MVRWAAAGRLAAGNDWVRFGPDRARLGEGELPRLTARFADGVAGVGPDMLVVARVFKAAASRGEPRRAEGEPVAIIPLAANARTASHVRRERAGPGRRPLCRAARYRASC